jgi:hypothetical protein
MPLCSLTNPSLSKLFIAHFLSIVHNDIMLNISTMQYDIVPAYAMYHASQIAECRSQSARFHDMFIRQSCPNAPVVPHVLRRTTTRVHTGEKQVRGKNVGGNRGLQLPPTSIPHQLHIKTSASIITGYPLHRRGLPSITSTSQRGRLRPTDHALHP